MNDLTGKEKSGFEKDFSANDDGNNSFVSYEVNSKVDPDAVYNTVPFYGKLPVILLLFFMCAPLGLYLLWRFQRKHIVIPIVISALYLAYLLMKGFQIYDIISPIINIIKNF